MIIIDILIAIIYGVGFLILFVLALAIAIPVGLLFGLYWLLFKSWRRRQNTESKSDTTTIKHVGTKDIKNIVSKAINVNKDGSDIEKEEIKEEIEQFVKSVTPNDIED